MPTKPRYHKYDSEFIKEAVTLANSSSTSPQKIALDLGIPLSTLRSWMKKHRDGTLEFKPAPSPISDERSKIARLEKQVRLLKEERDILKKAMAYCVEKPE
jgi:transposase